MLKAYRSCRLKYKTQYVDGFSPPVRPAPLEFGSAYHVGMEVLYNPETWHLPLKDLYQLALAAFTAECQRQQAIYLRNVEAYVLDPEEEVDYEARIKLGAGMLRKAASDMNRDLPGIGVIRKVYTPVYVEEEAFAPIRDPDTGQTLLCKCNHCWDKYLEVGLSEREKDWDFWQGLPVVYGIRADAVLRDHTGGYWVVDWKTRSALTKDPMLVELDNQLPTYGWVLAYVMNLNIRGFIQVQFLKDVPKKPKRLLYPRLGRHYSIAKQARTDVITYARTVSKRDEAAYLAGLYDEHLEWLAAHGPDFTRWFKVYRTQTQLENIGRDLAVQVREMLNDPDIYPNPGEMICSRCWFQEPCLERTSGQDYEALLREQYVQEPPYYIIQRELRSKAGK